MDASKAARTLAELAGSSKADDFKFLNEEEQRANLRLKKARGNDRKHRPTSVCLFLSSKLAGTFSNSSLRLRDQIQPCGRVRSVLRCFGDQLNKLNTPRWHRARRVIAPVGRKPIHCPAPRERVVQRFELWLASCLKDSVLCYVGQKDDDERTI
jgi:hypothetical protein